MATRRLLMGNEAIAMGLVQAGCSVATAYPGTPASEILPAVARFAAEAGQSPHVQWAINEKVAFEIAYAGAISGLRTSAGMKQVGLNVAADPLMSAAYMGVAGGFVVISADDPGPHSSQTEQDSRLFAMLARIPVLDPASPREAMDLARLAFDVSESFEVPVMLRPTTRVCHARQDVEVDVNPPPPRRPRFDRDPRRWAATPKYRLALHRKLEEKLALLARDPRTLPRRLDPGVATGLAVVASGVVAAHLRELFSELLLWDRLALFQTVQPFPLHEAFGPETLAGFSEVVVVEESMPVIEMQLADRGRVRGRLPGGPVPPAGELTPEVIEALLRDVAGLPSRTVDVPPPPERRPTLCAGCPHRASFFAIRKAAPKAICTSDIGCYTLGLNLGAVDTVLCMGASVGQAAGFWQAFRNEPRPRDVVATIGDSTFFHSGVPPLVDAVAQGVRFLLVVLDNRTTAMTGGQPTPATGRGISGEPLAQVDLEGLVRGCGARFCRTADPEDLPAFVSLVKEALAWCRQNGPAVIVARHPCLLDRDAPPPERQRVFAAVDESCDGCGFCLDRFECPALVAPEPGGKVTVDTVLCSGCGVCLQVCPKGSIRERETER